ncbi:hypothetical protein FY050_12160 [Phyllobacterium endophyticum]|nr:hypothetical protein FY050_12160 [Phyllobacterium endophyticum]
MVVRLCWLLLAVFLASCSGGSDPAQEKPEAATSTFTPDRPIRPDPYRPITPLGGRDSQSTVFKYGARDAIDRINNYETKTSKAQTINLNGTVIAFTATAGHLRSSAREWERYSTVHVPSGGTTIIRTMPDFGSAAIFYTAYTRDDLPKGSRPVTFIFNGGPGSASADLDLGFLGPKDFTLPLPASGPLQLIDNPNTLLDKTDLVFVDPIGTGYSSAVSPGVNSDYWGVERDAQVLSDFVTRYVNVNNRQLSPKYIYGVSYSGIRVPVMSGLLLESETKKYSANKESTNILNGLILNSPLLDLNTDCLRSYDAPCGGVLPTYAMVASYKDKYTRRDGETAEYVDNVREFAAKFNKRAGAEFSGMLKEKPDRTGWDAYLRTQDGADFVNQLYKYTGIGKLYKPGDGLAGNPWVENPNMEPARFTRLLDPKVKLQLTDGRVAIPIDKVDPSFDRTSVAYDYIKTYQKQFIGYDQVSPYLGYNGEIINLWNYRSNHILPPPANGDRTGTSINDLAYSRTLNPALKVLIEHGYYDLNTPFHQNELNIAAAGLSAQMPIKLYEGGHGVDPAHTNDADRVLSDLKDFYDRAPAITPGAGTNVISGMPVLRRLDHAADDLRAAGLNGGRQ